MNLVTNKAIVMKNGLSLPANTSVKVTFDGTSTICQITGMNAEKAYITIKLRCSSLPRYFSRFKSPSLQTMEKWSFDGVAKSILGKKVEPDGFDDEGSPSWLLVIGII